MQKWHEICTIFNKPAVVTVFLTLAVMITKSTEWGRRHESGSGKWSRSSNSMGYIQGRVQLLVMGGQHLLMSRNKDVPINNQKAVKKPHEGGEKTKPLTKGPIGKKI